MAPVPCVWLTHHGPMDAHAAAPAAAARLAALPRDGYVWLTWLVEDVGLLSLLYALIVFLVLVSLAVSLVLQPVLEALRNFNRWARPLSRSRCKPAHHRKARLSFQTAQRSRVCNRAGPLTIRVWGSSTKAGVVAGSR